MRVALIYALAKPVSRELQKTYCAQYVQLCFCTISLYPKDILSRRLSRDLTVASTCGILKLTDAQFSCWFQQDVVYIAIVGDPSFQPNAVPTDIPCVLWLSPSIKENPEINGRADCNAK
ncbi:uncharacterized protein LOC144615073 [Panthera onca]